MGSASSGKVWDHIGVIFPAMLAYIPSGNKRTLFLITSCTNSTMSSKNQKGSHPPEIVTTKFI
jgi:hypothetical protein